MLLLVVGLALTLACAGLAQAAEVTPGGLLGVVPGQAADAPLTRGALAAMLNAAAELPAAPEGTALPADVAPGAPYAAAVKNLLAAGIVQGYPDGTFRPGTPVTRAQAALFVARTLGLPEVADPGAVAGLERWRHHWAYGPYAWVVREGLMEAGPPDGRLTAGEGARLLAGVFGPALAEGREIEARSRLAQKNLRTMRAEGTVQMRMKTRPVPGMPAPEGLPPDLHMTMDVAMEMNLEQGLHQTMTMKLPFPGAPEGMTVEQYYTPEGVFMKVPGPEGGEAKWQKMPADFMPDFTALMRQSLEMAANPLPPEIEKAFYHRYLGEAEVDGRAAYKVATYGRVTDLAPLIKLFSGRFAGDFGAGFEEALRQLSSFVKSMHMAGTTYLDRETLVPLKVDAVLVVAFAPEFMGQPNPVASFVGEYHLTFRDINGKVPVVLPEAAKNAPVLEMPPAGAEVPLQRAP
ncbi:MAG: S-layer homology domain-containing protein [Bacillota bacterium]